MQIDSQKLKSSGKWYSLAPSVTRILIRAGIIIVALIIGYFIFYTVPFLTTGLTLYTLLLIFLLLFYNNMELFLLRFFRSHVIIFGSSYLVPALVRNFLIQGFQVVLVEKNITQDKLHEYRDLGARVIQGDPTDPEILEIAGVRRARYLLCVSEDDGMNAEIALRAYAIVQKSPDKIVSCFVHIVDPNLCSLLSTNQPEIIDDTIFRLEFFNIYKTAAYIVLKDYPPFPYLPSDPPDIHLLLIGGGRMGENLIIHCAKNWRERYGKTGKKFTITLIDNKAQTIKSSLTIRYPTLLKYCEIISAEMKVFSPEFLKGEFLISKANNCNVTSVYVCLADEYLGLSVALDLIRQIKVRGVIQRIPIIIRTKYSDGLTSILNRFPSGDNEPAIIHAFPVIDRTCGLDLIIGSTHELTARAIHEEYLQRGTESGLGALTNPAMKSWEELPEFYREANRRQADDIFKKLKMIQVTIIPLTDWESPLFQFPLGEIEFLAQMEHARWMKERLNNGWSYGQIRDEGHMKHPCMIPYEQLSEEEKEKDRESIRAIPKIIRKVDLDLISLKNK